MYIGNTSCMSWDTFDVTHVATCKHENEEEWLGTKRGMPFQLPSQLTKLLFQVLSSVSRPMVEKVFETIVTRCFHLS